LTEPSSVPASPGGAFSKACFSQRKAVVRAHPWRRRIESGQAKSISEPREQEGVTDA
jgi:hypothetical protein